jgi:hypothetical protein
MRFRSGALAKGVKTPQPDKTVRVMVNHLNDVIIVFLKKALILPGKSKDNGFFHLVAIHCRQHVLCTDQPGPGRLIELFKCRLPCKIIFPAGSDIFGENMGMNVDDLQLATPKRLNVIIPARRYCYGKGRQNSNKK